MALLLLGVISIGMARKQNSQREKARYFYLEGLRQQTDENNDRAYELFKHAARLDPQYAEAASAFGSLRLANSLDTLQTRAELARSLRLMRPFVDQYPEDYNEATYYAYVATHLDSIKEAIRVYERTNRLRPDLTSNLYRLSEVYMADGNVDSALNVLSRYEEIEGMDPQITVKKISYRLAYKDTVGAINEATALVNHNPAEPAYLILKGNIYEMTGDKDSTLHYFKEAERLNPDYGAAKLALADYYRQEGDSAAYDTKTYEALLSEDFDMDQKVELLGQYLQTLLSDNHNTERGDYLFSVLRNQYPHEPNVLDLAARYSAAKGDYDEAVEEIGYAIDQSPTNETYRGQLMTYYLADDRPEDALKAFREAEKVMTPGRSLMVLYASAAQMAEDYPLAIEAYKRVAKDIAPTLPLDGKLEAKQVPASINYEDLQRLSQVFTSIGDSYYSMKDLKNAFVAYDNALLLFPDNAMALNNYAYFLIEDGGDLEKAAEMSERSLEGENSSNPTFLDTFAWILYKQGKYDEARKFQAEAVEISEREEATSAELYNHYGDILEAVGEHDEAIENWKKALELDPDNNELQTKIKKHHGNK